MTILKRSEEKCVEDCELILDCYNQLAKEYFNEDETAFNNKDWAHGRKHIFLSEGARQQLEYLRVHIRNKSATKIQSLFRGYLARQRCRFSSRKVIQLPVASTRKVIANNLNLMMHQQPLSSGGQLRSRPKPISCTPPPFDDGIQQQHSQDKCDFKTIQQTCSLFGLDLVIYLSFFFKKNGISCLIYFRRGHLPSHPADPTQWSEAKN